MLSMYLAEAIFGSLSKRVTVDLIMHYETRSDVESRLIFYRQFRNNLCKILYVLFELWTQFSCEQQALLGYRLIVFGN